MQNGHRENMNFIQTYIIRLYQVTEYIANSVQVKLNSISHLKDIGLLYISIDAITY